MKKMLLLFGFFFAWYICPLSAQKVADVVRNTALRYPSDESVTILKKDKDYDEPNIAKSLAKKAYFDYDAVAAEQLIEEYPEFLSMEIEGIDGERYVLDLVSAAKSFEDMVISTGSGKKFDLSKFKAAHYRGVVRGQEKTTLAGISLFDQEMSGLIYTAKGNLVIGKLKGTDKHIFYKDAGIEKDLFPTCETEDPPLSDIEEGVYNDALSLAYNAMIEKCVKLYFETEFDIYEAEGGTESGVVTWVTSVYNNVAILFANEFIQTSISEIKVWDITDPYTGSSTSAILNQFQQQIGTLNGDLGQLLTGREIAGGGIAAGFNGLCNPDSDKSLSASAHMTSTFPSVMTFSWNVQVVTHEFGHLFGSRHTHACVWNGNNTAIDGCAGGTEGGCQLPSNPSGGGTIMSYCHLTSAGINFNLGFGLQPGNVIRGNVAASDCIASCCNPDQLPQFTLNVDCNDGNWSVTATPFDESAPNHLWQLYQTTTPGSTSGGTLVGSGQSGSTATFQGLDVTKFYYITHSIWAECYETKTAALAVPNFTANLSYVFKDKNNTVKNNFCYGEDIYLDPAGTSNYDRFFMAVYRRPIGGGSFSYYADYEWTFTNNIGLLNLSQLFFTSGQNPGEIFQPGYEYELQFAIANPPGCTPWTELKKRFTVECCEDFFSAAFRYELRDKPAGFEVYVFDFEPYTPYATHEWTVFSSPNENGGPYTLLNQTTTTGAGPLVLYDEGASGIYYFVIHRVVTLCGEACYIQRREGHRGSGFSEPDNAGPCDICGPDDCSILEEICFVPEDLTINCYPAGVTIDWDPVAGVTTYWVQVTYNDPACCSNGTGTTTYTYYTSNTYYVLYGAERACFSWRVAAICESGPAWTEYQCFRGCEANPGGGGNDGLSRPDGGAVVDADYESVVLYPNPADAQLKVILPHNETAEHIRLLDMYGRVVFEKQQPDQQLEIDCKAFPTGMYTIQVIHPNNRQTLHKVQITH